MARKLTRNKEGKYTLMRENALKRGTCMWCRKDGRINQLFKYWKEMDMGGIDRPDRHALPFCSISCYRDYYKEAA